MTDIPEEKITLNTDIADNAEAGASEAEENAGAAQDNVLSAQIRAAALAYAKYLKDNDLAPGDATFAEPEEALGFTVMQVIAFYTEAEQKHIICDILKGCDDTRWHPVFADCIARGTNKASGIDHVCRHYGFQPSETMAFGDGGNDIEMLRHAGIGVAMGNASDEVKAAADYVTESVDDDGVAKALQRLL